MATKTVQEVLKQEHIHDWRVQLHDRSEERCICGKLKVSSEEHNRRTEEWDSYYQIVKTTQSYLDFQAIKKAFKESNQAEIERVRKESVSSRMTLHRDEFGDPVYTTVARDNYIPKPTFPDPINYGWRYEIA